LDFELLLLPELELASPLDADALELLSVPLLAVPEPTVSDDELSPVLDACAPSSTLITALLTWPDELAPVALELDELAALAVEFD
jgi:hypothetical protein